MLDMRFTPPLLRTLAQAHLGWVPWRLKNIDKARALTEAASTWDTLPGLNDRWWKWTYRWPACGLALHDGNLEQATAHIQPMLLPNQIRLPDDLTAAMECVAQRWEGNEPRAARDCLEEAAKLAESYGYL
jgi:hypothetical protein